MKATAPCPFPFVSPQSLAAAFAAVPDPRRPARVAFPLPVMLGLAVSAIPANHLLVLAIQGGTASPEGARTARLW